jgi:hypothetical protein
MENEERKTLAGIKAGDTLKFWEIPCLFNTTIDEVGTLYRFYYCEGENKWFYKEVPYIRVSIDEQTKKYLNSEYQYVVEDNPMRILKPYHRTIIDTAYIGTVQIIRQWVPYVYLLEKDVDKAKKIFTEYYTKRLNIYKATVEGLQGTILNLANANEIEESER